MLCIMVIIQNMVEIFIDLAKCTGLLQILNKKYKLGLDGDKPGSGCPAWGKFTEKKKFEPYEKLIPASPPLYYKKGNPDYKKIICLTNELEYVDGITVWLKGDDPYLTRKYSLPKGNNASDIAKKCDVSSQDVTNFIKINRIADKILDEEY